MAGEYVTVRVTDTGVGMDQKTRGHVFEPFFTTKPLGKGTGLGLATVHGIVRQAGGFVDLDSALGRGTQVSLSLPRSHVDVAVASAASPIAVERLEGRVLLVEDEPLVMRATSRLLEELGLTVISASEPDAVADALALNPGPLALLVTDVVMPGRSGLDLVVELRSRHPGLPVLLLSGYATEDLQHVLSTPRTRFLAKPYTRAALSEALHHLILAPAASGLRSTSISQG